MSTIVPPSELTRKAIAWISSGLEDGKELPELIDQAGMRFNLGPLDCEFLRRFFKENPHGQPAS